MQKAIDKSPVKEKLKLENVRSALRYRPVTSKKVCDQTKLGKELELFLVNLIIAFSVHLMGMTRHMLRGLAAMMVPSAAPFSARWCKRFLKRHKAEIKERSGKKSHKRKGVDVSVRDDQGVVREAKRRGQEGGVAARVRLQHRRNKSPPLGLATEAALCHQPHREPVPTYTRFHPLLDGIVHCSRWKYTFRPLHFFARSNPRPSWISLSTHLPRSLPLTLDLILHIPSIMPIHTRAI